MSEPQDPKPKKNSLKVLSPEEANLAELSVDELKALKDAILARARQKVGPEEFNPVMMATTTGGEMFTDDWVYDPMDKYILVASLIRVIRVIGISIATAGSAIATGMVLSGTNAERYGSMSLAVTGLFSVLLLTDLAMSAARPTVLRKGG